MPKRRDRAVATLGEVGTARLKHSAAGKVFLYRDAADSKWAPASAVIAIRIQSRHKDMKVPVPVFLKDIRGHPFAFALYLRRSGFGGGWVGTFKYGPEI